MNYDAMNELHFTVLDAWGDASCYSVMPDYSIFYFQHNLLLFDV